MFTLNCKGRLLIIEKPIVMGIINITNDSFYSGSRTPTIEQALLQAEKMLSEGATILDVGAQSTRPGSEQAGAEKEAEKILPVVDALRKNFTGTFISVDTYHAKVAKQCVEQGADIINDISGGTFDNDMLATIAALKVPFVCMHTKGNPETMQKNPVYENATKEVLDFFIHQTFECKQHGINDIIIDTGFGFGKTIAHNFELLHNLLVFKMLEKPILAGISRKSTIYKTLGISAEEALNGSTVLHTIALMNGANILRVHDVKEAMETIELVEAYKNND